MYYHDIVLCVLMLYRELKLSTEYYDSGKLLKTTNKCTLYVLRTVKRLLCTTIEKN